MAIVNIPFIRWLQETDISLAWFAMLWVFVAWLQGYGAVWGISAMLDRNNDIRKKVPEVHKTTTLLYWIFLFLMIFMGVQLAVGTFRTYKNNSIQNTEIQSLITSDKQTELNNQQLTNEIDKLITQLQTTTPISSK